MRREGSKGKYGWLDGPIVVPRNALDEHRRILFCGHELGTTRLLRVHDKIL